MNRAFTLIELMIVVAIISIIAAIAIPNLMESRPKHDNTVDGVTIQYKDIVGKTLMWNGVKTLITNYDGGYIYTVVIMPQNGGATNVEVNRQIIMAAYKATLKTQAEKPE